MDISIEGAVKSTLLPFKVIFSTIKDVEVIKSSNELNQLGAEVFKRLNQMPLENLKNDKIIRKYRDFYWQEIKIDPTKIRPAGEALIRRYLQSGKIPNISNVVDAINLASIDTHISFGAYDLKKLKFPLRIRFSEINEPFLGIGMNDTKILSQRTLTLSDLESIICVYPYRDAERTKITNQTESILLMTTGVPAISLETLQNATNTAIDFINRVAKGKLEKQFNL
ncbi:MAG: B3/B4 domain-containing protein [Candidatus Ranarchaeia archaeon]